MVQDITPEDTQVRGGRIGAAGKFAADPYRFPSSRRNSTTVVTNTKALVPPIPLRVSQAVHCW